MEFVTNKRPGKYLVHGYTKASGTVVGDYFRSYPATTRQVDDARSNTMRNSDLPAEIRDRLKRFLKACESLKRKAYQDSAGIWTIGSGDTENVKPGDEITLEEADRRLEKGIDKHKVGLDDVMRPLSDNERIGLGSFLYNTGSSSLKGKRLLKRLNEGDKIGTAVEMSDFLIEPSEKKDAKKSAKGLVNRRLLEIGYVLTPDGEPIIKLRKTLTDDIMREAGPAPVNATLAERKAWMNKVRKSARKHVKAEVERILDTSSKK